MKNRQTRCLLALLSIFIVTCTFLIVSGVRSKQRAEAEAMLNRANEFSRLVSDWLEETQDTLQIIDFELQRIGDPFVYKQSALEMLENLDERKEYLSDAYLYNPTRRYGLLGRDGLQNVASLPEGVRTAGNGAMKNRGKIFITEPYMAKKYNVYCITLSKAIYDENDEVLCVACIDCYLDKLISILGKFYQDDRYAFLADTETNIINHPYAAYQMRIDQVRKATDLVYRKIFEKKGIQLIQDYDGKCRAGIVTKDDKTGFYIVVLESWKMAYGAFLGLLIMYVLTLIMGIILVIIIMRSLARAQAAVTESLRDAAEVAEKASKAKSVFLANMSHEIRTPIHAILGMDEMILRETNQPEIREYAYHISQAGDMLLSLINSILDFSKLESGKMELYPEEYNLREQITEIEYMIAVKAKERGLRFIVSADENLPAMLVGDAPRISQVILNLLSNALKYTEEGEICFNISLLEWKGNRAKIRIEVSDTGIGIRDENLDKLFISFERVEEGRNRSIEGTGLGLSIVQRLLALMNTVLCVDSTYGVGSSFSFEVEQITVGTETLGSIPSEPGDMPEEEELKETSEREEQLAGRLLVVDDVALNLMVLNNFLKDTSLICDTAKSGKTALELLSDRHYDLIFLDHMMPEMDGIEALKKIRGDHLADDTPCIALTANAVTGARQMYLKEGFDDYLTKPVSRQDFLSMIQKYIGGNTEMNTTQDNRNQEEPTAKENLMQKIPELDFDTALKYCAESEDIFFNILTEYVKNRQDQKLDGFFAEENWDGYRIEVHALKSSSLMVGLTALSEEAKALEMAAKGNDVAYLTGNHKRVMEMYQDILSRLGYLL